eukprot:4877598-Pyramimonas_sp.AAC.1
MENGVKLAGLGFRSDPPLEAALKWRRYTDDVMSFSLCYCPGCVQVFVENMFSEPVSVVFQLSGRPT